MKKKEKQVNRIPPNNKYGVTPWLYNQFRDLDFGLLLVRIYVRCGDSFNAGRVARRMAEIGNMLLNT